MKNQQLKEKVVLSQSPPTQIETNISHNIDNQLTKNQEVKSKYFNQKNIDNTLSENIDNTLSENIDNTLSENIDKTIKEKINLIQTPPTQTEENTISDHIDNQLTKNHEVKSKYFNQKKFDQNSQDIFST